MTNKNLVDDFEKYKGAVDWFVKFFVKTQELLFSLTQVEVNRYFGSRLHDSKNLLEIYARFYASFIKDPHKILEAQGQWIKSFARLYQSSMTKWVEHDKNLSSKNETDLRFSGEMWQENPLFNNLKNYYLATSNSLIESIENNKQLDKASRQKLIFFTKQILNAFSPSNFLFTNPELLLKTIATKGHNILQGIDNLLEDIRNSKYTFFYEDSDVFAIGKNIAVTPGKVVFRNKLIELIQYQPTTAKVHSTPVLICPPWINKYYILDLTPQDSFIKWLVDKGHIVFTISWANPDKSFADIGWEDYMKNGVIEALEKVLEITKAKKSNLIGFCIGGTLAAMTNAYLTALGKGDLIASTTYLMTMLDFHDPGNIGVFIDKQQIELIEEQMNCTGYLNGYYLASMFNLLKANELIWSNYVKQYLAGEEAVASDILFWNSDPTNLPAKMHSQYLRWMYLKNLLVKGLITIDNIAIDLTKIKTDSYFISAEKDHIVPWKSCFAGLKHMGGKKKFVLTGSGHIVGAINHPDKHKYYYSVFEKLTGKPLDLKDEAKRHQGSWWLDWEKWLKKFSNTSIKPYKLKGKLDAPGTYVKIKARDIEFKSCN